MSPRPSFKDWLYGKQGRQGNRSPSSERVGLVSQDQGRLPGGRGVVTGQADSMEFGVRHVALPRQRACGLEG